VRHNGFKLTGANPHGMNCSARDAAGCGFASGAALQPAFFHNGAFTRLEDAIRHHLNVVAGVPVARAVSAQVSSVTGVTARRGSAG
jgi:cytochrome c peroxidase